MLVSAIGYLNSSSKSLYGVESNKNQSSKSQLSEGFGHFTEYVNSASYDNNNQNILSNIACSIQTLFTPKADETKKYLSLIA